MKKSEIKNPIDFVAPLARARGLGSSRHGAGQWVAERVSAAILLPLVLWLTWSVVHMGHDYAAFTAWLHWPVNAMLMVLTMLPLFYHAACGLVVVIEDYVHGHMMKFCAVYGVKTLALAMTGIGIVSILKVAFSG